jgi:DNA-binding MarR family transcriptional regulator
VTITGTMDEPTGLVVTALRSLDLGIDRVRTAFAHRYRITIGDSLVISHLAANGYRLRPGEIAARILVTSGTLTPMLDRLESAKFVRREPNPDDRRSVIVVLTEQGEAALDEYREQFRQAIEAAVPADMRRSLADCMTNLAAGLDKLATDMAELDPVRSRR